MTHSGDQVVASVEATFPKSGWARVLDLLESYGVESYERERKRVQLAILNHDARFKGFRQQVVEIGSALSEKNDIPMVAARSWFRRSR